MTDSSTLYRSLAIQLRVTGALLLREIITRYGRHSIGVLWLMVEPMLFTLGVATVWTLVGLHTISDIPVVAFAITGYSSVLLWRNISARCAKAIEPNLALMYHRNVKVIDIFSSRIMLEIIGASASFSVLTIFFAFIDVIKWPQDLLTIIIGWLLLCWFSYALGLIVGCISERSDTFERVWHIFTYLLFPMSGAVFMVDWLPPAFQNAVLWLPMVHGTEMVRHGYFGQIVPTYEDINYFIVANMVFTLIGLLLVKDVSKRVQPM